MDPKRINEFGQVMVDGADDDTKTERKGAGKGKNVAAVSTETKKNK